jgi:hypothetical protein
MLKQASFLHETHCATLVVLALTADSEVLVAIDRRSMYIARTGNASLTVCIYLQSGFGKSFRFIMARLAVNLSLKNRP